MMMTIKLKKCLNFFLILILIVLICAGRNIFAEKLFTQTIINKQKIYMGEIFIVMILVNGSDKPQKPDLSGIKDFHVRFISGEAIREDKKRSYVFQYNFIPRHTGKLNIPSIEITTGDKKLRTESIPVTVLAPEKTGYFKLDMTVSRQKCYVGEPIVLTVKWYIDFSVNITKAVDIQLPILHDSRFDILEPEPLTKVPDKNMMSLPVSDMRIIANRQQMIINNKEYFTLTFSRILIPREAGRIRIKKATVFAQILLPKKGTGNETAGKKIKKGVRRIQSSWLRYPSYFNNDFFEMATGTNYKRCYATSESIDLEITRLPSRGRPYRFTGLITDRCSITVTAQPKTVNPGEPITLTIRISNSSYPETIILPPLREQISLASDFKIPLERSPGIVERKSKLFFQTIRPIRTDVKKIPPIEFHYFNPKSGKYMTAMSQPIPIKVKNARVFTAYDSEGYKGTQFKNKLEYHLEGLAHNYADIFFGLGSRMSWVFILIILPVIYTMLAGYIILVRNREVNPEESIARKAYTVFKRQFKKNQNNLSTGRQMDYSAIDRIVRSYLSARLRIKPGAITYLDAEEYLVKLGVKSDVLTSLKIIFDESEKYHFAGSENNFETQISLDDIFRTIKNIEKQLK